MKEVSKPGIKKKISRSVTDSDDKIKYKDSKPGISNLINIYTSITNETIENIEKKYEDKMYSDFKNDLSDIIIELLEPIQNEYNIIIKDKSYLEKMLKDGSEKAAYKARRTISKVYRKVGFVKK